MSSREHIGRSYLPPVIVMALHNNFDDDYLSPFRFICELRKYTDHLCHYLAWLVDQ